MAYATVDDLQKRFRIMDPQEGARASALLDDASAIIDAEMDASGVPIDGSELQTANLKRVCCAMVSRALSRESTPDATYAFGGNLVATASGELFMKKSERSSLGIGRTRAGFASYAQ